MRPSFPPSGIPIGSRALRGRVKALPEATTGRDAWALTPSRFSIACASGCAIAAQSWPVNSPRRALQVSAFGGAGGRPKPRWNTSGARANWPFADALIFKRSTTCPNGSFPRRIMVISRVKRIISIGLAKPRSIVWAAPPRVNWPPSGAISTWPTPKHGANIKPAKPSARSWWNLPMAPHLDRHMPGTTSAPCFANCQRPPRGCGF